MGMNELKTIEQYDEQPVWCWNFYEEELNTFRLLGIRTVGDLLRRFGELEQTASKDPAWDALRQEAERLGVYHKIE